MRSMRQQEYEEKKKQQFEKSIKAKDTKVQRFQASQELRQEGCKSKFLNKLNRENQAAKLDKIENLREEYKY